MAVENNEEQLASLSNEQLYDPQEDVITDGKVVVRIRGQNRTVPAAQVSGLTIVSLGRFLRVAQVKDEDFLPPDIIQDPAATVADLSASGIPANLFTFSQQLPDGAPRLPYHFEWDNLAVVRTTDFSAWWEALPQETRKNVRRSRKKGVTVRPVEVDDEFVRGVVEIYNDNPLRQGKPFYHYGKTFETVKSEVSTFSASSGFIGAYKGTELVGFIKLVYRGSIVSIMHIIAKNAHADARPMNALIAEAVATCFRKGATWLVYGNYTYGRKGESSLAEFKRRNGFVKILVPRYFVPLSWTGAVIMSLKLYRGPVGLLPQGVTSSLLWLRRKCLEVRSALVRHRATTTDST